MSYVMPSLFKPQTQISSKLIPMVFVVDDWSEYISDNTDNVVVLREKTVFYTKLERMTMATDMAGRPVKFKIYVDPRTKAIVPIENLIYDATKKKELGSIKGTFKLSDSSSRELITKIYEILDSDTRRQISKPLGWLVYDETNKVLTRLSFMLELSGEIKVLQFGSTNILLEIEKGEIDHVNSYSRNYMMKSYKIKEQMDNLWTKLQLSEEMSELADEFIDDEEEETKKKEENVKNDTSVGVVE